VCDPETLKRGGLDPIWVLRHGGEKVFTNRKGEEFVVHTESIEKYNVFGSFAWV
jgi:hypothetical protein